MSASGSLATLRLAELLQVAALFKKMGSIRLVFPGQRVITVYLNDGALSGLTDSGRVWQLGDLLASLGHINSMEKQRLLTESTTHGKRLGQLLIERGYLSKIDMEQMLRRLTMQSLLFAAENESSGTFEMQLGAVSQTTMMFPITDILMELTSAIDELERLRKILGPGGTLLWVVDNGDESDTLRNLPYRKVQVLAHVDGQKSPMDVAATSPFSPTETLSILCDLARSGVIDWVRQGNDDVPRRVLGMVVPLRAPVRDQTAEAPVAPQVHEMREAPDTSRTPRITVGQERRTPGGV
jgi:hypothetical protein